MFFFFSILKISSFVSNVNSFEPGQISGKLLKTWYVILQKKSSQTWYVNLRLFFFLTDRRLKKKKKQKFHGTTKDLIEMATSTIFFLVRAGQEEKKKFLGNNKRIWESWQRSTIFFPRSAFFRVVWTLQCFRKNSRYEVSFYLSKAFKTFRFIWPGLTRFRKSRKLTYQARKS